MLSVSKLIASALECLGWPYESPGTNDERGIDCSGLWVKCFRDQGSSIYHGSNTIFRDYCSSTEKITSESQLKPGMAVFKCKNWTEADKGNKWYGKAPGNLSHIGMVTGVNPLVITHATSPVCKQDFKIGNWAYCGYVKNVDYGDDPGPSPEPQPSPEPSPEPEPSKTKYTYAENGKPINLRVNASTKAKLVDKVPVGQAVTWLKDNGAGWAYVQWQRKTGWMMDCFLVDDPAPAPEPSPEPDPDPVPPGTMATVWASNGKPVKMRARPSTGCDLYDELPVGTEVEIVKYADNWCRVNYGIRKGWYIMTQFLGLG